MKLIVGLGNPGNEYSCTRHNVGFMAIDKIVESLNLSFDKSKFGGLYVTTNINGEKIIFLKPQEYINLSGNVIKKFKDFFNVDIGYLIGETDYESFTEEKVCDYLSLNSATISVLKTLTHFSNPRRAEANKKLLNLFFTSQEFENFYSP